MKFNSAKCELLKLEVDYVGHRLTGEGFKPSGGRVKAILEMKDPEKTESEIKDSTWCVSLTF